MFVPCPMCGVTLSSDGPDRYCLYCDRFFNEMPVKRNGKFVSQSFFYDRRRPPRCNIALDIQQKTLRLHKNGLQLINGVDYEVGEQNNTVYIRFVNVPEDGDYMTVDSEVE